MALTVRLAGLASVFMCGVGLALPALALDCTKAAQPVEKRICTSPRCGQPMRE